MAHSAQQSFCSRTSEAHPKSFNGVKVLEIGSLNINGTVRDYFSDCVYTGSDVNKGKDVDIVSRTKDLPFEESSFDTIISAECFEHDSEYNESIIKIMGLLKEGGLFVFTCATTGRPEHGTLRSDGDDYGPESGYYKNLVESDFRDIEGWNETFPEGCFITNGNDLYFYGIKQ